jgi:hypothetical protein
MRILRPIVEPLVRAALDIWHDLAPGGCVGAELVGDRAPGWTALFLQETGQQVFRRFDVAARLYDFVEHIAILINRPPEPMFLAGDRDHDLIQVQMSRRLGGLRPARPKRHQQPHC